MKNSKKRFYPFNKMRSFFQPHTKGRVITGVAVIVFLLTTSAFAQKSLKSLPDLGAAKDFAIVSGGTMTNNNSNGVAGLIGAIEDLTGTTTGVADSGTVIANAALVIDAVKNVSSARALLSAQNGAITFDGGLETRVVLPGIYNMTDNTVISPGTIINLGVDTTVSINAPSQAIFIFNIPGDLTVGTNSNMNIGGINPAHIIWNVSNNVYIASGSNFSGVILAGKNIALENNTVGAKALLAEGNVRTENSQGVSSAATMANVAMSAECPHPTYCNSNFNDLCNLVPNPEVCPRATHSFTCEIDQESGCDIPGWNVYYGSPQFYSWAGIDDQSSGALFMWSSQNRGEGVLTCVNIEEGKTYLLSYHRKAYPHPDPLINTEGNDWRLDELNLRLVLDKNLIKEPISRSGRAIPTNYGINQLVQQEVNIPANETSTSPNGYVHKMVCFTADNNYDRLWIYPKEPGNWSGVQIDQVEIYEDFLEGCNQ